MSHASSGSAHDGSQPIPALSAQGQASVRAAPDLVGLSITVVTDELDAQAAMDENNKRMKKVRKALEKLGLKSDELATGTLRLDPRWNSRPHKAGSGWRPQIEGYVATNELQVRTRKLELAGKLLTAAIGAGANQLGNLNYDIEDPTPYQQRAIAAATKNALMDIRTMADAANVSVGNVLAIDLHGNFQPRRAEMRVTSSRMADSASVPLEPGELTISANVSVRAAISQ